MKRSFHLAFCLSFFLSGIAQQPPDLARTSGIQPIPHSITDTTLYPDTFRMEARIKQGRYLEETGQSIQAIDSLEKALPAARQLNNETYADALKYMAIAQKGNGNLRSALQYYEQYIRVRDSLAKQQVSQTIADLEARYKEREETLNKAAQNRRLTDSTHLPTSGLADSGAKQHTPSQPARMTFILGLATLGTICFLLFVIYRNKEKTHGAPNRQNAILGSVHAQFIPIDLSEIVRKELHFLQQRLTEKNLRVSNEVPDHFLQLTDEHFISLIIRSLLQNAVTYSNHGDTITIRASGSDLRVITPATDEKNIASRKALQHLAAAIQVEIIFSHSADGYLTALLSWTV